MSRQMKIGNEVAQLIRRDTPLPPGQLARMSKESGCGKRRLQEHENKGAILTLAGQSAQAEAGGMRTRED
jgi:hypothetical protein